MRNLNNRGVFTIGGIVQIYSYIEQWPLTKVRPVAIYTGIVESNSTIPVIYALQA